MSTEEPPIKIAVVNSHPITYFAELYRDLNTHPRIDLTAIYFSDMGISNSFDTGFNQKIISTFDLLKGYKHVFCGKNYRGKVPLGFFSIATLDGWRIVRRSDYDVIWFHGYNYLAFIVAFFAAKISGKTILFRCETHLKLSRPWYRRWIRDTLLKPYLKQVNGFLAIGSLNKDYYKSLGIQDNQISLMPYSVKNQRFESGSVSISNRGGVLSHFEGFNPEAPTILFCAKFIPRKHPELILKAMKIIQDDGIEANVIMAGNGPLCESMKDLALSLSLKNVSFTGFVDQTELPKLYSICDLFVHPSEDEPWGLVINEVMAAGLPVLVGRDVGCAKDLVKEGVNGYTLPNLTAECLATYLEKFILHREKLEQMGQNSKQIIADWDYKRCMVGLAISLEQNGYDVSL